MGEDAHLESEYEDRVSGTADYDFWVGYDDDDDLSDVYGQFPDHADHGY